jgi:general secretion pathway protein G
MSKTLLVIIGLVCAVIAAVVIMLTTSRPLYSSGIGRTKYFIAITEMTLEIYKEKNGVLPTTEQGLSALLEKPTIPPIPENWNGPYYDKDMATDAWGKPIQYRYPSIHPPNQFDLWSFGPDKIESVDDIHNWDDDQANNNSNMFYSVIVIIIMLAGLTILAIKYPPNWGQLAPHF